MVRLVLFMLVMEVLLLHFRSSRSFISLLLPPPVLFASFLSGGAVFVVFQEVIKIAHPPPTHTSVGLYFERILARARVANDQRSFATRGRGSAKYTMEKRQSWAGIGQRKNRECLLDSKWKVC